MRRLLIGFCFVAILHATAASAQGPEPLTHYDLQVRLDPATSMLEVTGVVTVPQPSSGDTTEFLLSAALEIVTAVPSVEQVPLGDTDPFFGNNGASGELSPDRVARYRVKGALPNGQLRLTYRGRLNYGLSAQKEEYTRGFRETPGIIGKEGVYLAGASFWYPHVGPGLVTFSLEAHAPATWHVVSQGEGSSRDASGAANWKTTAPMDEIYLVGGPPRVWRDRAGAVETLVYLHDDDGGLANKYLVATAQYLEMYRALIGPYPYSKFALVENFWETGYGMPSFTLLGPSIVRFPFIITSSYPHEILHNWWGNSVFVDYESGNWCEGLTAYLADHLIQEQQGRGASYRRATLQKYVSYVKAERDFPLTEFRSRESAATEAVGYGKTLMGVHMLRRQLGDDKFKLLLARFYREFKGKRASFRDFQHVAEGTAGASLAPLFDDWITRAGAPRLTLSVERVTTDGSEHVVRGTVRQTQAGPPFRFDIPVVVQTTAAPVPSVARFAKGPEATFEVRTTAVPLAVHVDPGYDVFRALDPREIPPSIGQIFGESRVTAVLPGRAPAADQKAWRALVESWRTPTHVIDFIVDSDVRELPGDRAVWVLGRENRLAEKLFLNDEHVRAAGDTLVLDGERVPLAKGSAVVTRRHPNADDKAIGWIVNSVPAAFDGLGRKLPHYGRYSYLGFEGAEPVNTIKGEWPTTDSPLSADVREEAKAERLPPLALPPDKPLIDLPPTFSQKALADHVAWLASPAREGRGIGTNGLQQAAEYIAEHFKATGLTPAGDNGGWFQAVPIERGPGGKPARGVNVIGLLPGTRPELEGQSALVSAHYDHLGRGWPEAHAEDAGQLHPGADDNASGVAVLVELARVFAAGARPPRSIVFVAFTGEEAGLVGARFYAEHPVFPLEKIIGVVNLDTVGRLSTGKISILGAGTATEWPHIFRGAGFVTGIESTIVAGNYEASDQRVFIERGIPAVQVFTGPHADYHRPGDTADKVDAAGLVKVATVVKEAVAYLSERPTAMTVTIAAPGTEEGTRPAAAESAPSARRVSFGAVPDFAFEGKGVRLSDVTVDSPAAKAGLKSGDVITRVDDTAIGSLQDFSATLKALHGGQTVKVVFLRDGAEQRVDVTVVAR